MAVSVSPPPVVFTVVVISTIIAERLLLDAVEGEAHDSLLLNWQLTTSLLFSVSVVKVLVLPPTVFPFTFHVKVGDVPPPDVAEVKVTDVPRQTVSFGDTLMLIVGVITLEIRTTALLDVAVDVVVQPSLLVITQISESPLTNVFEV